MTREPAAEGKEAQSPRQHRPPADDLPALLEPVSDEKKEHGGPRPGLELAGIVIAATTLLSALAFYFGWAITSAKLAYFGIDASALGFSTQDYILRSTDALFLPLGAVIVFALFALTAHQALMRAMTVTKRLPLLRASAVVGVLAGAVVLAVGVWGALEPIPVESSDILIAATPGIGIALFAYSLRVIALVDRALSRDGRSGPRRSVPQLRVSLVYLFVGLSAFWTTAEYAAEVGNDRGRALGEKIGERPAVTVYSAKNLGLAEAGATERRLGGRDAAYRYRYSGLRLMFRGDARYFLVADGWQPSSGAAIVLAEDPSLRFEFQPGRPAR